MVQIEFLGWLCVPKSNVQCIVRLTTRNGCVISHSNHCLSWFPNILQAVNESSILAVPSARRSAILSRDKPRRNARCNTRLFFPLPTDFRASTSSLGTLSAFRLVSAGRTCHICTVGHSQQQASPKWRENQGNTPPSDPGHHFPGQHRIPWDINSYSAVLTSS